MFGFKFIVWLVLGIGIFYTANYYVDDPARIVVMEEYQRNNIYGCALLGWLAAGFLISLPNIYHLFTDDNTPNRNGVDDERPLGARRRNS